MTRRRQRATIRRMVPPWIWAVLVVALWAVAPNNACWGVEAFSPSGSTTTTVVVPRSLGILSSSHAQQQPQEPPPPPQDDDNDDAYDISDSWSLIVLGDLHMEDDMTLHEQAREDCLRALDELSLWVSSPSNNNKNQPENHDRPEQRRTVRDILPQLLQRKAGDLSLEQLQLLLAHQQQVASGDDPALLQSCLVSLGDLGRKDIRHQPGDAGTTQSFEQAKEFLNGFGLPYELVSGNHDLEGLDEFDSDAANLQAWMDCFDKPTPQFCRYIGDKTVLLGLSTVRFRDAPYSSHEVHVDDKQLDWFVETVKAHPAEKGWKVLVFSHAPITGSGLRVLQNVHVTNGCAWLNHCSPADTRNLFHRLVELHPQIKLWCSGHFHLSQEFPNSISTRGSCTFCQVGVMGPASTRDGTRQTRIVRGCRSGMQIYTVQHHFVNHRNDNDGDDNTKDQHDTTNWLRLDADIDFITGKVVRYPPSSNVDNKDATTTTKWFQAYTPRQEDGCYLETTSGNAAIVDTDASKVCWWHMKDGQVLGLHQGQLVEYDAETLSPLGIVLTHDELKSSGGPRQKQVVVVEQGTVLAVIDKVDDKIQVIHPNDDGSYWRKVQRNKKVRQEEKAREAVAQSWLQQQQQQLQQ